MTPEKTFAPRVLVGTDNRLIAALSPEARHQVTSRATVMPLPVKTTLYRPDELPHYIYYVTSGMASIVTSMEDGGSAEVGIVGCEGMVGSLHLLGPGKVATNCFIQLEGTGLRIPFAEMRQIYRSSEEVRDYILEYVQEQAVVTCQLAACNRLHEAEERLARWLLMATNQTQSSVLDFTQEFLAMMLGARRTTVTMIAGVLQKAGLIEYSRGHVRIMDYAGLESAACACYPIVKKLNADLYQSTSKQLS